MADLTKFAAMKSNKPLLPPAPKAAEALGNIKPAPEPVEAKPEKKGPKGRPPLDYQTRQLGARVHVDTFARVQAIAKRERVGLGPLVDRMVAAWERQRLAEAEAIGPRRDGENDDAYVARIFKL